MNRTGKDLKRILALVQLIENCLNKKKLKGVIGAAKKIKEHLGSIFYLIEPEGYPTSFKTILQELMINVDELIKALRDDNFSSFEGIKALLEKIKELDKTELSIDKNKEQFEEILEKGIFLAKHTGGRRWLAGKSYIEHGTPSLIAPLKSGFLYPSGKYNNTDSLYFLTAIGYFISAYEDNITPEEIAEIFGKIARDEKFVKHYCEKYGTESLEGALDKLAEEDNFFGHIYDYIKQVGLHELRAQAIYFNVSPHKIKKYPDTKQYYGHVIHMKVPNKFICAHPGDDAGVSFFPLNIKKYAYRIDYYIESSMDFKKLDMTKQLIKEKGYSIKLVVHNSMRN